MKDAILFAVIAMVVWGVVGCNQNCADCDGCWLAVEFHTEVADTVSVTLPETTRVAARLTVLGCDYDIENLPVVLSVTSQEIGGINQSDSLVFDTTNAYGELDFTYSAWSPGCNMIKVTHYDWQADSVIVCGIAAGNP